MNDWLASNEIDIACGWLTIKGVRVKRSDASRRIRRRVRSDGQLGTKVVDSRQPARQVGNLRGRNRSAHKTNYPNSMAFYIIIQVVLIKASWTERLCTLRKPCLFDQQVFITNQSILSQSSLDSRIVFGTFLELFTGSGKTMGFPKRQTRKRGR